MSNVHPPPPPTEARPSKATPLEKDKGFGESHGYGPCHGGPSGPGDAPSKQAASVVPLDDDSPDDDSPDEESTNGEL